MLNGNSNGYSLSDIAAATGTNGMFGDGNGSWWIILLFILFIGGWNGNGFGWGNNGMNSTMNTDYLAQGMRDMSSNLASNFLTLNNELLSGFCDNRTAFAENTASLMSSITNGFNTQNLANLQNTNALQAQLYQMNSQDRADTCAINTNNATNTRDIIDAINTGNQQLANILQQNKFDAMQDKINDLQNQLQTAQFAASQAAQTSNIVDQLRPSPVPAYQVQNPYCNCGNWNTYATV